MAGRVASPLVDIAEINRRLDIIEFFMNFHNIRNELRDYLHSCPDLERSVSRLGVGRGGRAIWLISKPPALVPRIKNLLLSYGREASEQMIKEIPDSLRRIIEQLGQHANLVDNLERALDEELPLLARDGGFVRPAIIRPWMKSNC